MKEDVVYTYLQKVLTRAKFSHYELHYCIKLSNGLYPVDIKVEEVDPVQNPLPILKQMGLGLHELTGWDDHTNKNTITISFVSENQPVLNPPLTKGVIRILKSPTGPIKNRNRWDQICVIMEHDHPPHLNHSGSSTVHLPDGD